MNPKLLKVIIAVVIIGVAFLLINSFMGTPNNATIVTDNGGTKFVDDTNIVTTLNRLKKVVLDNSIFTSAVFTSLVNFERPITDEPLGRKNPFAPIGTDGVAPIRSASTSTAR